MMSTKTFALVAASIVGTLGFAETASAQVMYGYNYRNTANRGAVTYPVTPGMYTANYVAPMAGGNLLTRGYNQYTAGLYGSNPYTGLTPSRSMRNSMHNSGLGYGNFNNFGNYNNLNNFNNWNNFNNLNYGTWNGRGAAYGSYRGRW